MKKILVVLMLLGPPVLAQYAHTSNPGVVGGAQPTLTANGQCVTVASGGSNSAMVAITGTWTGTLSFFGTNDGGVTSIALQSFAITTSTGALNTSSVNTATGNGVWISDTFGMARVMVCATAAMTGTATLQLDTMPADVVQQITGVGGGPVLVSGSLSVAGAADVVSAGAPTTFNANSICTGALLTAGLQSAGFHFDVGTLVGTFTAQCSAFTSGTTNFTNGGLKDVTGASVTGAVTSPNAQTDWTISCPGDTRRVQVCTTAFSSGSTTGEAVGTFYQTATASSGSGGGVVTQPTAANLNATVVGTLTCNAGTGTLATSLASLPALPANQSINEAQINGVAPAMGNGVTGTGTQRVTISSDSTGALTCNAGTGSFTVVGAGTSGAPAGGMLGVEGNSTSDTPINVRTSGSTVLAANAADNSAVAAILNAACTTTTACSSASSIQWPMNGQQGATVTITAQSTPVGTALTCDPSWDGGVTYALAGCDLWQAHGAYRKGALTNTDVTATAPQQWQVYAPGSPSHIRIRMATFTSGSVTVAGRATMAPAVPFPFWQKPQSPNAITLTASTAETTLIAAVAGTFLDLSDIACSTSAAAAHTITVRDTTGGATRKIIACPAVAGPCEGWVFSAPLQQTALNTNWTIQDSASVTSDFCSATAVQR